MGVIGTRLGAIGVHEQGGGGGGGVPIVFLHGVGSDKSVWRPQIAHFGQSRRAIALDYPGYGESAALADGGDFAGAILATLDSLGVERAHVCGLSLGGIVAIAMHAQSPKRCQSLILADTFARHPDGAAIHQRSVDASRTMSMRALAEARADVLLGSEATAGLRAEVVETMAAIDPAAYRIGAKTVWLADQRDEARAIRVPTLVLCGAEDRITPPALSEELAALVPGARLELVDAAGHLANAEQPAAFNAAIDRFLAEVESISP